MKPLILITNDDGYQSQGLRHLVEVASAFGDIVVMAPERNSSGLSTSITTSRPLRVRSVELAGGSGYACDGTPVDCVKMGVEHFCPRRPDLVLSGINYGANLATDILYSGTVGAAREGFLHDIPSFAISLDAHSEIAADEAAAIFKSYLEKTMAEATHPFLYNINFPKSFQGREPEFLFSRQGRRDYLNAFIREEREGRIFYSVAGEIYDIDKSEATDIYATEQGFISVTPLITDLTDYQLLDEKLSI